ncbi:MAG: hypothetical protein M1832_000557 [Thelocarpon impressellum]|nr:MAG: hypothetical protein M1832_000557 [Thelocarpon impressellum]
MSLKQEIETWVQALGHYDNNEFEEALKSFDNISDTSKILFNMGVIQATLGEHGRAVESYQKAIRLDQYLAVAYFQQGVSNFLVGDFEEALANFNDTLLYLRGNNFIDYDQLGLKFKLYSCEVLFNRGLCYIYLQQKEVGLKDFEFAVKEKVVEDHNVIDDAIREQAEGYTVFSIPVGVVYRPNDAKVKNLKTKDYLGKARLVAASDRSNAFTGFAGSELKAMSQNPEPPTDDRPAEALSFAATNLVKPELRSRARQQSEPPMNRTVFPPTPPPESDKQPTTPGGTPFGMSAGGPLSARPSSLRGGAGNRPEQLDLSKTREQVRDQLREPDPSREKPRLGTMRTASEPRGPSRNYSNRYADYGYKPNRFGNESPYRPAPLSEEEEADEYPGELYDMYRNSRQKPMPRRQESRSRQRPRYIEEEEEEEGAGSEVEDGDMDEAFEDDFEMVSASRGPYRKPSRKLSRAGSRRPEVSKVRVKVHVAEDTRYVMIGTAVEYADLVDKIRDKFALRSRFKCKLQDDGDMITMADQDDLDMAMMTAKSNAKRERAEMGKMEMWVHLI